MEFNSGFKGLKNTSYSFSFFLCELSYTHTHTHTHTHIYIYIYIYINPRLRYSNIYAKYSLKHKEWNSWLTKSVRELLYLPTNLNRVKTRRGVTILNSWNKSPPKNTKYCNRLLCRVTEFWNELRARRNEDRRMLCEDTFQNVIKLH